MNNKPFSRHLISDGMIDRVEAGCVGSYRGIPSNPHQPVFGVYTNATRVADRYIGELNYHGCIVLH